MWHLGFSPTDKYLVFFKITNGNCCCRIGHGSFMSCLETLYKKFTGLELKYMAKLGKPSEITYYYAEHVLQSEARRLGLNRIRRMYCIGWEQIDALIVHLSFYLLYLLILLSYLLSQKCLVCNIYGHLFTPDA